MKEELLDQNPEVVHVKSEPPKTTIKIKASLNPTPQPNKRGRKPVAKRGR